MKIKNNGFIILTVIFLIAFITLTLTLSYHLLYSRQKHTQNLISTLEKENRVFTNKDIIKKEINNIQKAYPVTPYEYIFYSEENKKIWLEEDITISKTGYFIVGIFVKNKDVFTSNSPYNSILSTLIKQKTFPVKLEVITEKEILDIESNKKFIIRVIAEIEFKNKNIHNPTDEWIKELHIYDE